MNQPTNDHSDAGGGPLQQPVMPDVWIRRNGSPYKSGVAHFGPECPVGWRGAAVAYYSLEAVTSQVAAERERCAKLCESMGPVLCESYGDGAECIATADACAEAIRRA